jgi:hypothetical protein
VRRFVSAMLVSLTLAASILVSHAAVAAAAGRPDGISYHYTSLSAAPLPDGFVFNDFTVGIDDFDRVYGNSYDGDFVPHVSRLVHGRTTILQSRPSVAHVVSPSGVVGGSVLTDPVNFVEQAAIFVDQQVEVFARRPDEVSSYVVALNRARSALVASFDRSGSVTYLVFVRGRAKVVDLGSNVTNPQALRMNDEGFIAGIEQPTGAPARAFRYDPVSRRRTLLEPLPSESDSWGLGINNRLEVLGYSFDPGATERIGTWDARNRFHQYFVEGVPAVPTISNRLLFNEQNLIVITDVSAPATDAGKSFIIPRPGVRLDVADLVDNPPAGDAPYLLVTAENNRGSLIGVGRTGTSFLLRRTS